VARRKPSRPDLRPGRLKRPEYRIRDRIIYLAQFHTQKEIAAKLSVSDRTIRRWLTGENKPSVERNLRINQVFRKTRERAERSLEPTYRGKLRHHTVRYFRGDSIYYRLGAPLGGDRALAIRIMKAHFGGGLYARFVVFTTQSYPAGSSDHLRSSMFFNLDDFDDDPDGLTDWLDEQVDFDDLIAEVVFVAPKGTIDIRKRRVPRKQ
jgi:transcriptional regulator with XRE-family HTH domain